MNTSISTSTKQLLALVRASLWQEPADVTLFSNDVDWQKIGKLALQQTVGILAFEAALSLPANFRPPKEWIRKALTFIETNRRTHILVNRSAAEVVCKLKGVGIDGILLKGQAYAHVYPRPEMRQCGDIDLYVGESNYLSAYEAVKEFGWKREDIFLPKAKHYGCWINGIRIELHRIAGQLYTDSYDMKFQKWSRIQFSITDKIITIAGQEITLPTPIFDIIFVFLHLYHHFLNGGIGLRHICDWTMLLHRHAGNIDTEELRKLLKDFHLINGWSLFAPIAVEHLGLRESECPFYYHKNKKKSDQILSYIIREGNFGRASQKSFLRPKGYIAGKAYSFLRHSKKLVPKIWIDPYILSLIYGKYAISGTTRVIKDIIKKKYTILS